MRGHLPFGFRRALRRELRQIAARPSLAFMLAPYPVLLFVLLALIFGSGLPTNLPIGLVDHDQSVTSRQIARALDSMPDLTITERLSDLSDAKASLLAGRTYGILYVPQHAERDLLAGDRPEIVTFYNNQLLTIGGIVSRAANTAITAFSSGVSLQLREVRGQSEEAATVGVNPIPLQQSPLFNPALDYTQFLLAAIMPTVLQIFMCAGAAMAIARDRHTRGGLRRWVRLGGTPVRALCGKLFPYAVAGVANLWFADAIIFGYFGAPFRGDIALQVAYTLLFVATCLSLGTLIGLLAGDTAAALGLVGVLTAPAFGFAGISFPRLAMNGFSQAWGSIIPVTPYLQLRTDQVVRGAPVDVSVPALGWLTLLLVVYLGAVLLILVRRTHASSPSATETMPETRT